MLATHTLQWGSRVLSTPVTPKGDLKKGQVEMKLAKFPEVAVFEVQSRRTQMVPKSCPVAEKRN